MSLLRLSQDSKSIPRQIFSISHNVLQLCEGWAFIVRLPNTCPEAEL